MLSRRDIEKELGKGISIYPFNKSNIKENSINVTISDYAWTQGGYSVCWYGDENFRLKKDDDKSSARKTVYFKKGKSAIFDTQDNKKYLILLPHQTTVIETLEVIALGEHIGGAVHSKVGIVAKGIGDTGTMLGPGYCGHLMVSLHNITDDVIALRVGTTFVSLTFDYLNTRVIRTSSTVSSHYDKLLELGIKLNNEDKTYFTEDWKTNLQGIREQMVASDEYKEHVKFIKKNSWKEFKKYINKRNIIAFGLILTIFILLFCIARYADKQLPNPVWEDRFWNVGCSGMIGSVLIGVYNFIRENR